MKAGEEIGTYLYFRVMNVVTGGITLTSYRLVHDREKMMASLCAQYGSLHRVEEINQVQYEAAPESTKR